MYKTNVNLNLNFYTTNIDFRLMMLNTFNYLMCISKDIAFLMRRFQTDQNQTKKTSSYAVMDVDIEFPLV